LVYVSSSDYGAVVGAEVVVDVNYMKVVLFLIENEIIFNSLYSGAVFLDLKAVLHIWSNSWQDN